MTGEAGKKRYRMMCWEGYRAGRGRGVFNVYYCKNDLKT